MATLTIRRLDERVKAKLRIRAAQHGRSMEEEARGILEKGLEQGLETHEPSNWVDEIRQLFEPLGGMELELPPRTDMARFVNFDE
jgi:plasmid stability protein